MQDFLKDRPVMAPQDVKIITSTPVTTDVGAAGPFARIVRDESVAPAPRPTASSNPKGAAPPAGNAPAHSSQVRTIVENGRVARIVVTCSCGKVTEIACVY